MSKIYEKVGNRFERTNEMPNGVIGRVSYERLFSEVFAKAGEVRDNETVTAFYIDNDGITFVVETK